MIVEHELDELLHGVVDMGQGFVSRRIFSDPAIYEWEQSRVFGRCWLFLAHESQIPNVGDFMTCRMGETPVIVSRDTSGKVHALINSCRHRGNMVTRADAGSSRTFTCPYHGWCYDLQGKRVEPGTLVAVPGHKTYYDEEIDFESWGLVPVAQVASYRGMIFGNFDPDAPSLEEYLGDFRWFLDMMFDRGNLTVVPGVLRWQMKCNWKFAADNAIGDNSHAQVAHRSAFMTFEHLLGTPRRHLGAPDYGFTLLTEYGHGANCKTPSTDGMSDPQKGFKNIDPAFEQWRQNPEIVQRQGPFRMKVLRYNGNVFPNLFVIDRLLMMRNPLGPGRTEIRAIALFDQNSPPEIAERERRRSFQKFGPSGFLEQEDGENWDQATVGAGIRQLRDYDLHYRMGLGKGRFVDDGQSPPRIDTMINEYAQLWFYQFWADAMRATNWDDLRMHHAKPAGTI